MSDGAIFSPETSILTVNNAPIRGRVAGEYLTWTPSSPWVQMFPGVDGVGYYVLTENRGATITVRVQPNSVENDIMDGLLVAQIAQKARLPIVLKEGRTVMSGAGMIQGRPPITFSDGQRQREWVLLSTFMAGKVGGMSAAMLGPIT